jgi:hypothetical protein
MRFGQLIANLAFMAAGPWDQSLWDLEDEELLVAVRQFEADLSRRAAGVAEQDPASGPAGRAAFPGA